MSLKDEYIAFLAERGRRPPSRGLYGKGYCKPSVRAQLEKAYGKGTVDCSRGYSLIIDNLARVAERRVSLGSDRSYSLPPFFMGEYPTADVNARACKVEGGYLFLFNSGLFRFLGQCSRLLTLAMDAMNVNEEDGSVTFDESTKTSGMPLDEIAGLLVLNVEAYLDRDLARAMGQVRLNDRLSKIDRYLREHLLSEMEAFVAMHEVCHAACGHLDRGEKKLTSDESAPYEWLKFDQNIEFEADLLASRFTHNAIYLDKKIAPVADAAWQMAAAGIAHFFVLADLIERVLARRAGVTYKQYWQTAISGGVCSHPPAMMRLESITKHLRQDAAEAKVIEFLLAPHTIVQAQAVHHELVRRAFS